MSPWAAIAAASFALLAPVPASAQDVASLVARARELVEAGNYPEALRMIALLEGRELPPAVAVESALLETTAALVVKPGDVVAACKKAIVASGYDPDVARDQSPKVRAACRDAAADVRGGRLEREGVKVGDLEASKPEVAWQPVRLRATVEPRPEWLQFVARVGSKRLEGTFDVALVPGDEGKLYGTLDASWLRPGDRLQVQLVAQDRFGDLGEPVRKTTIDVPEAEGMIALGDVPSGAVVKVDGRRVTPAAGGRIPVEPGPHEVEMIQGEATAQTDVEVARGGVARVALSPAVSRSNALAWIATGTSVACLATGGVLMLVADGRRADIEEAAARREPGTDLPATDYAQIEGLESDRAAFSTAGTVLLVAGGATAVLATTLWLWPSGGGGGDEADEAAPGPQARAPRPAAPSVGATLSPGWVGLRGSF
jgi:hypothetical protein